MPKAVTIAIEGSASDIGIEVFARFIAPAVRACAATMPTEAIEDLCIGVFAALHTEMTMHLGRENTQTILRECLDTSHTGPTAAPAGSTLQ